MMFFVVGELDTGPQIIYSKSMQILGSWSGS